MKKIKAPVFPSRGGFVTNATVTAGDLIAFLQKFKPETTVYVGSCLVLHMGKLLAVSNNVPHAWECFCKKCVAEAHKEDGV